MSELKPLPDDKYLFHQLNSEGLLETIDERTGDVVRVQTSVSMHRRMEFDPSNFVKYEWDGREVWLEKGVSPEILNHRRKHYTYSKEFGDIICQKIMEGAKITHLCKHAGFPDYSILCKWRRDHEDFNKAFKMAVKDRAWHFQDKMVEEAETDYDKDRAHLQKARIDAYKNMAERSNPDQFGNKTKVISEGGVASFVIVTGVPQPSELAKKDERDVTSVIEGSDVNNKAEDVNSSSAADDNDSGNTGADRDQFGIHTIGNDRSS